LDRGAEAVERLQARALLHVSVKALGGKAQDLEERDQAAQRGDGVHEDDHQAGLLSEDVVK
jgi:hypothetical protein